MENLNENISVRWPQYIVVFAGIFSDEVLRALMNFHDFSQYWNLRLRNSDGMVEVFYINIEK
jgi:hypothetical protein